MSDSTFTAEEEKRIREAGAQLAKEKGLRSVATELSISTAVVMNLMRGSGPVTVEIAEGIARMKGVSLLELLDRGGGPPTEVGPSVIGPAEPRTLLSPPATVAEAPSTAIDPTRAP